MKNVNSIVFPQKEQAYHSLLTVIARDKTFYEFENDWRINRIVRYYNNKRTEDDNHVRALLYQGIVRSRIGMPDSSVYLPLRKAETIFIGLKKQKPETGYMLNYFIGNTYYNNNNITSSDIYFKRALEFAKIENDNSHIIDAQLALFWNYTYLENMDKAKLYLDSISKNSPEYNEKAFFILNAKSFYHQTIGNNRMALEYDKQQLAIFENLNDQAELSKLYYSISNQFVALNQIDSAMYYAEKALMDININKPGNYLYYKNLANIAKLQDNFQLENEYLAIALEKYRESVYEIMNNEIKEVERKYDLSLAENSLLKSRQTSFFWALAALITIVILLIVLIINRKIRSDAKEKLMNMSHNAAQQKLEAKLLAEDANKMKWMISIYSYLSERLTNLQDSFESLSQKYISSHPKVYDSMNLILSNTSSSLKDMYNGIHPNDDTFTLYTGLAFDEASKFNANEKMMLMLLASEASNKQIATFMNSTLESVRARKSQLKRKMIKEGINIDKFFLN